MTQTTSPNRRAFLGGLMAAPLLTAGCWHYDRYFTIEWDEEVELHDGRIIIVHIKRTFERVTGSMRRSRWKGMQESTEIKFDANGKIGKYQKKFDEYNISYINFNKGNWYIKLRGLDRVLHKSKEITISPIPVWIIESNGQERPATSWSEVPFFQKTNLLPVVPDSEGISKFNNKLLTLSLKKNHWKEFPYGYKGDGSLRNVNNLQPLPE